MRPLVSSFRPVSGPLDIDAPAFRAALLAGLPAETKLEVRLSGAGRIGSVRIGYNENAGEEAASFFFRRTFLNKTVNHDVARVSPRLQGKGIGRTVNRNLFPLYREQGMEKITIIAENVGAYAHARTGFTPDDDERQWGRIRREVAEKLEFIAEHLSAAHGPLPPQAAKRVRAGIADASPKGFWAVADEPSVYAGVPLGKLLSVNFTYLPAKLQHQIGRAAFLGGTRNCFETPPEGGTLCGTWYGSFDLRDPECMRRAENYFRHGGPKSPSRQLHMPKARKFF